MIPQRLRLQTFAKPRPPMTVPNDGVDGFELSTPCHSVRMIMPVKLSESASQHLPIIDYAYYVF